MPKYQYITFVTRKEVCEWLNKHIYSTIAGITESDGTFTIFYTEYDEETFIRDMEEICCDPGFFKPSLNHVQPIKRAPEHHKNADLVLQPMC